jgi:hypothetical protein
MTAPNIDAPEPDRRESAERRLLIDRRSGVDRRQNNAGGFAAERRNVDDRRAGAERRAFRERRLSLQSAGDQIRGALKLMTLAIESGQIPERDRRTLDAAMLRLRFALERLEEE